MANTKQSYFKGEDHKGRMMTAYQRGPADPDIVGKMFGMKNVTEISKAEFDRMNGLGAEQEIPKAPPTSGMKDVSTMKGKELLAYGKELGLDFPAVGMKLDDMRAAIAAFFAGEKEPPSETAELKDGETSEPLDGEPVPEDMTEAAGGADQEDD